MPSTHVNANKESVVVVVVVVVIWLKRRVPILSVAIMSGAWAPTVSFSPPPPSPVARGPWGWGTCVTPPLATAKETGAPNDFSLSVLRKK